jgi:hypothetical protein
MYRFASARRLRPARGLLCLLTITVAAVASPAAARTYTVSACDAAPAGAHGGWIASSTSRALRTQAVCPTRGHSDRGLRVTVAGGAPRWVARGTRAEFRLSAPRGTALRRLVFAGRFTRRAAGWRVGIDTSQGFFAGCPSGPGACSPGRRATTPSLRNAAWVRLVAVCLLTRGCATHAGRAPAVDGHLTYAAVTVGDDSGPVFDHVGGGATAPRWLRGTQLLTFQVRDASGIRATGASVGAMPIEGPRVLPCDFTRPRPCAEEARSVYALRTASDPFVDGRNTVAVTAVDAAGNASTFRRDLYVDNHPPGQVSDVASAGGEGWRARNGFDIAWTAPGGQVAPIVAAHYRLCVGGRYCLPERRVAGDGRSGLRGITVPVPGDWTLQAWLEDAAGNASAETRSAPVHLRFDDVPPAAVFDVPDPQDPRHVEVSVADPLSGVAGGQIQIRRRGDVDWRSLTTHLAPGRLTTTLDDRGVAPGTYELRAAVGDGAVNVAVTGTRRDGRPALLEFPLRLATRLEAAFARGSVLRCHRRRHPRCRRIARRRTSDVRLALGRPAVLVGSLTTGDGRRPLPGQVIRVSETPRRTAHATVVRLVWTDGSGAFRYRVEPGPSRVIELRYGGSGTTLPSVTSATLSVPAVSTLHVDRHRVLNGDAVVFSGRLRGGFVPSTGKLVALQAYVPGRGRWITFATPRTDVRGAWSSRYRFRATVGVVRYRFRLVVPREIGYPFEEGRSPTVAVTVRGR